MNRLFLVTFFGLFSFSALACFSESAPSHAVILQKALEAKPAAFGEIADINFSSDESERLITFTRYDSARVWHLNYKVCGSKVTFSEVYAD